MPRIQQVCSGLNPFKRSSRSRSSSGSAPDAIHISAPQSQPFNYDAYPIAPWQNDYSTHTPNRLPIPPPKDYSLKYMPLPVGTTTSAGLRRQQLPNVPRRHMWQGKERKRSATTSSAGSAYSDTESLLDDYYTAARSPETPSKLGPLSPARMWNGGKRLLAQPDLHGNERFLGQYEELTKPDWGEPDEWVYGAHQHREFR